MNIELKKITVNPNDVFLDIFNSRFAGESNFPHFKKDTQPDDSIAQEITRRYIVEKHGGNLLISSISNIGFLRIDNIVVSEFSPGKYLVIEGNRRVAAIKTIIGDSLRKAVNLPQRILESIKAVEVFKLECVDSEIKLLLQGTRHISGVRNWGPYQQALLINSLVEVQGMALAEAAASVGLTPGRVSTLLKGYYGLKQMQEDGTFGAFATVDLFSCFEQAYLRQSVRRWLGWSDCHKKYEHRDELFLFYSLIARCEGGPKLLARDVREKLPLVLDNEEARNSFLNGGLTIDDAYKLTKNVCTKSFVKSAENLLNEYITNETVSDLRESHPELVNKLYFFSKRLFEN